MGLTVKRREQEIVRAILAYLKLVPGVVAWRQNTGVVSGEYKGRRQFVRYGFPGAPDILGWVELDCGQACAIWEQVWHQPLGVRQVSWKPPNPFAVWLAIEVKRPGADPTPAQQAFLDRLRRGGGIALVATSVDDVRQTLEARGLAGRR